MSGHVLGLQPERALCGRHRGDLDGEPAAVKLSALGHTLAAFLAHPRIQAETGGGQLLECGPAVEANQPLCCFLGDPEWARILETAIQEGR